jgi:integrase
VPSYNSAELSSAQSDPLAEPRQDIFTARDARGRVLPGAKMVPTKYRPETPCDAHGCENIVPAGLVMKRQKLAFCSSKCHLGYSKRSHLGGNCAYCGQPFYVSKGCVGKQKYCSQEHRFLSEENDNYAPTGAFRPIIETYLKTTRRYRGMSLVAVKGALIRFFGYVHTVEGAQDLGAVTPSMVTRFVAAETERGITSNNFVGSVSTFYKHMTAEDDTLSLRNPVISHIHYQRRYERPPRPYKDEELAIIRGVVEASSRIDLLLAIAIGEECGLRVGEVGNIRLSDVDTVKQTIFVRLPTKNMTDRTVPFHDGVAALLPIWLSRRNGDCKHDHLLHSVKGHAYSNNLLDHQFRQLFEHNPPPAKGFSFHRLRHTWATRLMNNGMELAVLMQLGGWKDWTSMRRYIKVLPSTIKTQYEEAYHKLSEQRARPAEPTISLAEFAMLTPVGASTTPASTA